MLHGGGREVGAAAQLRHECLGLEANGVHLALRRSALHRQEDVAETVLVGQLLSEEGRGEQFGEILLGDINPPVDHLALDPVERQLTAYRVAEAPVGQPLAVEGGNELVDGHAAL